MTTSPVNRDINTDQSQQSLLNSDESSSVYLCGTCKHPVGWEEKGVLCEKCHLWYHISCQLIKSVDYPDMDRSSVIWYCNTCAEPHYSITCPVDLYERNLAYSFTADQSYITSHSSSTLSVESLDETHAPVTTSSPTRHIPKLPKGRPLCLLNVNCQSICGKKRCLDKSFVLDQTRCHHCDGDVAWPDHFWLWVGMWWLQHLQIRPPEENGRRCHGSSEYTNHQ